MHGDEIGLSQPTLSRILASVSEAIASKRSDFIKFPDTREAIIRVQREFMDYCGFPGVIGAVDGTHIPIRSPGGDNALVFLNRKNRYSINVQVNK